MEQIEQKKENENKVKHNFDNLSMLCFVEIFSFLKIDNNFLNYRIISKRYNQLILNIFIFFIVLVKHLLVLN